MRGRVAIAAASVMLVAAGCSGDTDPESASTHGLVQGGVTSSIRHSGGYNETFGDAGRRFSMSPASFVCSVADTELDSVELDHPSANLRLVRWAIDNSIATTRTITAVTGPLSKLPTFVSRTIEQRCGNHVSYSAIGVEVVRSDDRPGTFDGLVLHYHVGGVPARALIGDRMKVCTDAC